MATNKTVFFMIGILLIVLGISMLAPYLFKYYIMKIVTALLLIICNNFYWYIICISKFEKEFKLNLRQTFLFSSLAWLCSYIWKFAIYFI